MYELGVFLLSVLVMAGSFWIGLVGQRFLRDHHRTRASLDSVRMAITLLVTFAAVVLGLLISSSETRFSSFETQLRGLSIDIIELDHWLREYGPEADPLRADLILYTKAAIADTWPGESAPPGNYPRHLNVLSKGSVESVELGVVLNRVAVAIRRLAPQDDFHRSIALSLRAGIVRVLEQRWTLIENGQSSLPWSFLALLIFWLAVIFAISGLVSPRNLVIGTVTGLATLSLASCIFLAVDLDTPLSGLIKASSGPLRDALLHITEAPLPAGAS